MRKIYCLILVVLGFLGRAQATHIVGGEFELKHLQNFNYQLSLNLYFDAINGNPGAIDPTITVDVYRKLGDVLVASYSMSSPSMTPVPYSNPACASGDLKTDKILYTRQIYLDPNIFSHPDGYYLVWERCCRNNTITNIVNPGETGQAFVLHFPPVTKNGTPFVNSSPVLFPPLSDYACRGELFYFDFSGTDPDGDSLRYSLVTPYRGFTSASSPIISPNQPAPYPTVEWAAGFHALNQISGPEPLNINASTGQLRVRPNMLGLFVFAVRCEEYRNGVLIGLVRRDFQLKVLECPTNAAPSIVAQSAATPGQNYTPGDTLHFESDGNRCMNLIIKDPDLTEFVSVTAIPVNFSPPAGFSLSQTDILNESPTPDSLFINFCLPRCMPEKDEPFIVDILVKDDGCILPKQDTIRVMFTFQPPANQPPVLTNGGTFSSPIGQTLTLPFSATDPDGDPITVTMEGNVPNLAAYGLSLSNNTGVGQLDFSLFWTPNCESANLPEDLKVWLIVRDQVCDSGLPDTTEVILQTLYTNLPPQLSVHPVTDTAQFFPQEVEIVLGQEVTFNVLGRDFDPNQISLDGIGEGFSLSGAGMQFSPGSETGFVLRNFYWKPTCASGGAGTYKVKFSLNEDTCIPEDTALTVVIHVREPEPEVAFNPVNIFTPNGDGLNDVFEMPTLPLDGCDDKFVQMKLFSRWGESIFSSPSRNFRWDGGNYPAGIYYYQIEFQKRLFKGYVTLVR